MRVPKRTHDGQRSETSRAYGCRSPRRSAANSMHWVRMPLQSSANLPDERVHVFTLVSSPAIRAEKHLAHPPHSPQSSVLRLAPVTTDGGRLDRPVGIHTGRCSSRPEYSPGRCSLFAFLSQIVQSRIATLHRRGTRTVNKHLKNVCGEGERGSDARACWRQRNSSFATNGMPWKRLPNRATD